MNVQSSTASSPMTQGTKVAIALCFGVAVTSMIYGIIFGTPLLHNPSILQARVIALLGIEVSLLGVGYFYLRHRKVQEAAIIIALLALTLFCAQGAYVSHAFLHSKTATILFSLGAGVSLLSCYLQSGKGREREDAWIKKILSLPLEEAKARVLQNPQWKEWHTLDDQTLFEATVEDNNYELGKFLIEQGADPNHNGVALLDKCLKNNRLEWVFLLAQTQTHSTKKYREYVGKCQHMCDNKHQRTCGRAEIEGNRVITERGRMAMSEEGIIRWCCLRELFQSHAENKPTLRLYYYLSEHFGSPISTVELIQFMAGNCEELNDRLAKCQDPQQLSETLFDQFRIAWEKNDHLMMESVLQRTRKEGCHLALHANAIPKFLATKYQDCFNFIEMQFDEDLENAQKRYLKDTLALPPSPADFEMVLDSNDAEQIKSFIERSGVDINHNGFDLLKRCFDKGNFVAAARLLEKQTYTQEKWTEIESICTEMAVEARNADPRDEHNSVIACMCLLEQCRSRSQNRATIRFLYLRSQLFDHYALNSVEREEYQNVGSDEWDQLKLRGPQAIANAWNVRWMNNDFLWMDNTLRRAQQEGMTLVIDINKLPARFIKRASHPHP